MPTYGEQDSILSDLASIKTQLSAVNTNVIQLQSVGFGLTDAQKIEAFQDGALMGAGVLTAMAMAWGIRWLGRAIL